MHCLRNAGWGGADSFSPLAADDLHAQLVSLNRFGLPGLGAAVANGLRVLISASRTAIGAALARCEAD